MLRFFHYNGQTHRSERFHIPERGACDKTLQTMGGWKDLATMKNIYVHTQDEDLEIARAILTSSKS